MPKGTDKKDSQNIYKLMWMPPPSSFNSGKWNLKKKKRGNGVIQKDRDWSFAIEGSKFT